MSYYTSESILSEYLLFHYGDNVEQYPWPFELGFAKDFHKRVVSTAEELGIASGTRALDLGCGTGRIAFELTRYFEEVIGIDYTESFIEAASSLREQGSIRYSYKEEGDYSSETTFKLNKELDGEKVSFEVGDAMNLRADIGSFDLVIMANLVDRLPDPSRMLSSAHQIVNPGGHLFILSPYTWMEEFTPKENWLCTGQNSEWPSFDGLKKILSKNFELKDEVNVPFLIRETRRKFQCSVSHGSIWKRSVKQL